MLPGAHFAAAMGFLLLGASGLVAVSPQIASGSFFLPRIVAVVHLFVLGWITLSIFGALCQFLPVAVGRPLRWERLAYVSLFAQVVGLLSFVTGLTLQGRGPLLFGAACLSLAFGLFAVNMGAALLSAKDRSLTFWALAAATIFLLITPIYGFLLAMNLQGDVVLADRFGTVAAHAHVAIVGFVLLVMVGVAHRLLPMFLLSHGAGDRSGWISVAALALGAAILSLPIPFAAPAAAGLISTGVIAFLLQAFSYVRHRKRREIDPGILLALVGLAGLFVSLLLAPLALSRGVSDPRLLTTYYVSLLGSIILFVSGHYYKIIPFIVWYHRFGPLVGKQKVPKVSDLWSESQALVSGSLLCLGWVGLSVSVYFGAPTFAQIASIPFLVGACLQSLVIIKVAQRRSV